MVKGSLWLTAARAATNALGFVTTIVLARLLVPADFGLVALGTTVLAIVAAVTEISLAQALVQHRAPEQDHFHTAWTLGVARGILLAALMGIAARPLAGIYHEPQLELVIYALAFSIFISGLANPRRVMLSRQLIFWQEFVLIVSQRLVTAAVAIAIALYFRSFWALIAGTIAGQITQVLVSYTVLPYRPRMMWNRARELMSFSIWITLGRAINTINWRADQLLVGGLLGRATLGFYSVGDNLAQMPTREATMPLTQTLFPALSRIADDPDRLRAGYQRAQSLITAIALPIGVGFALVAEPLVEATMGAKWQPAVPIIQALSAVFALQTLGSMVQPLGMAKGETKLLFVRDLQMFFVRLPVVIGAMLLWGLPGLIFGRVFTGLFAAGVNMTVVRRLTGLSVAAQLLANVRSLLAVAIMAASVLTVQYLAPRASIELSPLLEMISSVAIGAVCYLGSSCLMWFALGRPDGPERELVRMASRFSARLRNPEQRPAE
jgi:O-antigen/teichoic acid export membrane protein